ncbi:hypothetical protein HID58_013359, partial [Brassica napus]
FHIQGSRGGGSSTRSGVTTQWGVGFGRWSRLFMAEREDHVSPLDISRDLCVRGGVEGALLGLVVRWAHLLSVEVKDCSGVLSGDELRVLPFWNHCLVITLSSSLDSGNFPLKFGFSCVFFGFTVDSGDLLRVTFTVSSVLEGGKRRPGLGLGCGGVALVPC